MSRRTPPSSDKTLAADGDQWAIEENTKLAKLKNTAPDQYKRVQDAYTAYQKKDIAA